MNSAEGGKAVMSIERFGMIVLGVNDKGVNRHLGTQGSRDGIPKKRAAQSLPLKLKVNGKSSQPGNRHGWIARKTFDKLFRHIS